MNTDISATYRPRYGLAEARQSQLTEVNIKLAHLAG